MPGCPLPPASSILGFYYQGMSSLGTWLLTVMAETGTRSVAVLPCLHGSLALSSTLTLPELQLVLTSVAFNSNSLFVP